jgi:hypothetical protein
MVEVTVLFNWTVTFRQYILNNRHYSKKIYKLCDMTKHISERTGMCNTDDDSYTRKRESRRARPGMANLFRLVCQLKFGLLFSVL